MKKHAVVSVLMILPFCWLIDEYVYGVAEAAATNQLEIIWKVASNRWPANVWTYKVVPANFDPVIVSNLMDLGHFTDADRTKTDAGGELKDKHLMFFSNKGKKTERRELGISPLLGLIHYRDEAAKAKPKEETRNVASKDETYQLVLRYLRQFGVDYSQLATKADGAELRTLKLENTQGWFDETKGTNVERVISRGLLFVRRIDGIDFNGNGLNGGARIALGNNGQITEMEISWRGLQHFRLHDTLTKSQIIDAIRSKKTKWGQPIPNPSDIKAVTVNDVTLLYQGESSEKEQAFVEPLAILSASLDYGSTNISTYIECPIIN